MEEICHIAPKWWNTQAVWLQGPWLAGRFMLPLVLEGAGGSTEIVGCDVSMVIRQGTSQGQSGVAAGSASEI